MLAVFCIASLRLAVLSLVAAIPVEVVQTDGSQAKGELVAVSESSIVLQDSSGQTSQIPTDSVVSLQVVSSVKATPPVMRVQLAGGSQLSAQSVSLADDKLNIDLRRQDSLVVPARQVRSIRFRAALPATDAQWLGILESEGSGDILAVRREGDRLDQVRGVVESIGDNVVNFNVDGNQVQAPFDRLEGVVFNSSGNGTTRGKLQVTDVYGSRWLADSLQGSVNGDPLAVTIENDLQHKIPFAQLDSIRWNSSLTMLAGQPAAEQSYQSYVATEKLVSPMSKWFGPAASGEDLILHGDSSIEYRLDPGFERVSGSVEREDRVSRFGDVKVVIQLDGKDVWTQMLESQTPSGFDLPLENAKRIRFLVDSAGDGDLGDTVRIQRPRLLK